ncbi:bifunctional 4-hydroxy-2-oxoglutarate aldolase/2-dehydro-3-deoxy-phosphogluconate aldolase [Halobaculum sp. WSA2]|uniref:Bifunctional 4-hydroxy-2-oxoglutarate aldolase/2-dehydro-3-deoxy-phosphogluconate aldolase n=1 Tax=Halobaculum saliterrae TaxID=2073113 RepID=A0A6B0SWR7_9EURY|nr:bifunctional 4-hydroxy-2-oxoglutarate aldolase/2-dehydro-3-deoxy-phosphogluconate aldolase [Halobaculum saliterrae]MXR41976.1 bifunctional 4-hydroxy-2-oxoglutarate aldolase/2-dehydro-3-deoxy-phosphogluconate aldolase [Halobaculum saliterrae]
MSTTDAFATMRDSGVVAVLRGAEPETVVDTAEALVAGGVTALEVTADTAGATDMIATLSEELGDDALVGAGTVLDSETARAAIAAGAEFVVSPSFDEGVVETCNRYGVLCAPGVMTPTEAVEAYEAGAEVVKVFPAKTVGPDHVAALKGPLGHLEIMPTGGVSPDNAGDYIEAGAVCVGAGSALVDRDLVEAGDFDAITERAEAFREVIEAARE